MVTDVEILQLHYADTLKAWRERFLANRDKAKAIYDERFCRMWEFYLAASEAAFRWRDLMVFQIQLARANDTLPMTRDYMVDTENAPTNWPRRAGKTAGLARKRLPPRAAGAEKERRRKRQDS
jgi:cyclopropane-fatty-acyl-phospholipid synthase